MKENKEASDQSMMLAEKSMTLTSLDAKPVTYIDRRRTYKTNKIEKVDKNIAVGGVAKNPKTNDDLGFTEPNIKNAKSKISTWGKNFDNLNRRNTRMSGLYAENNTTSVQTSQLKEVPKYKIKVNNWLATPEPAEHPMILEKNVKKTKNNFLPNINNKKAVPDTTENKPNHFKKDPWLSDLPEETGFKNNNVRYEIKQPHVNTKAIYELLNKLTNRKPVKVNEDADLFGEINDDFKHSISRNYVIKKPMDTNRTDIYRKKSTNHGRDSSLSRRKDKTKKEKLTVIEPGLEESNNETTSKNTSLNEQIFSTTFKEDTKEILMNTLPLELRIGKITNQHSFFKMKAKKAQFYSKIQKVTAETGTIQTNPQIFEPTSKELPIIVKHTTYVSNPQITFRSDGENSTVQNLKAVSTPYVAEPLKLFNNDLDKETFWRTELEKSINSQNYIDAPGTNNINLSSKNENLQNIMKMHYLNNQQQSDTLSYQNNLYQNLTITNLDDYSFSSMSLKSVKPMLVGSLKLPGMSSALETERFEEKIQNIEESFKSLQFPNFKIHDINKSKYRSNKNHNKIKQQIRSNIKPNPPPSKEINSETPLFPGKLVPVYIYRHGRRLPVTSFRPWVPPPPQRKNKKNVIMSMESVLVADLKLPFMRDETPEPIAESKSMLVEELKIPVFEEHIEETKEEVVENPTPPAITIKEEQKLENAEDFHKNYRGEFHYPPEYAEKIETGDYVDLDKVVWENFEEVCLPKDFTYVRPKSSSLNLITEPDNLHVAQVKKTDRMVDESGVLIKEKTPEIPEVVKSPAPIKPQPKKEPKVSRSLKDGLKNSNSTNTRKNENKDYQNKYFRFPFRIKTPELNTSDIGKLRLPVIDKNSLVRNPVGLDNSIESIKFYSDLKELRLPKVLGEIPNKTIDDKYSQNFDLTKSVADKPKEKIIKIPKILLEENVKSKLRKLIKKDKLICKGILSRERVKKKKLVKVAKKSSPELTKEDTLSTAEEIEVSVKKPKPPKPKKVIELKIVKEPTKVDPNPDSSSSSSSESEESVKPPSIKKTERPKKIVIPRKVSSPEKEETSLSEYSEPEKVVSEPEVEETNLKKDMPPIKSALKIKTIKAHTVPQIKKKIKSAKPSVRFNMETETEHFTTNSESDYEEEFYEYLREKTNLDVNIELHEANINGPPKPRRKKSEVSENDGLVKKFHFHYHNGSQRICCSAHRKRDPYFYVSSVVNSFANIMHQPNHHKHQIFTEKLNWQTNSRALKSSYESHNSNRMQSGIANYSTNENSKWGNAKLIRSHSNENLHYIGKTKSTQIFSEKPKWFSEGRIHAVSQMDMRETIEPKNRILIFHNLPKWNDNVESKIKSFENFNYKSALAKDSDNKEFKIYDESKVMRWNAESRIKSIIYADSYIPQNQYFKVPKFDKSESHMESQNYSVIDKNMKGNKKAVKDWYPGYKVETFNIYYKPTHNNLNNLEYDDFDTKSIKWKSDPNLNEMSISYKIGEYRNRKMSTIYSEKLNWKSISKLKNISWENFNYKRITEPPQQTNRKPERKIENDNYYSQSNHDYHLSTTNSSIDTSYKNTQGTGINQTKSISKPNRDYLYKSNKKEDPERARLLRIQYEKFKKAKLLKLANKNNYLENNVDKNKVNSIQSFSKHKGLPQIKSSMNGYLSDRSFYKNDGYLTDRSSKNPKSRLNQMINKKIVMPEIKHSNQKRFLWDQELKRRAEKMSQTLEKSMNKSNDDINDSIVNYNQEARSMIDMNANKNDENFDSVLDLNIDPDFKNNSHLYGFELINDLKDTDRKSNYQSTRSYSRKSSIGSLMPKLNFDSYENDNTFEGRNLNSSMLDRATPRRLKQKINQLRNKSRQEDEENTHRALESRNLKNNYDKHDPQLSGHELHGSSIRIDSQTKVRPLANMNFKAAEDKAKIRAASRLYSSMMTATPRSLYSTNGHYLD